jgi:hypothetical protein
LLRFIKNVCITDSIDSNPQSRAGAYLEMS